MLDAGLAVVEIAAHGPHLHVVSGGGDHLLALDVAHAAIGEQHPDGNAVYALETLQGGLAGVAGGGGENADFLGDALFLLRGGEQLGQHTQRHILKGRGGAPEELQHLKISNGKWCWWSRNIGGTTALDYLTTVEGVSFLDAVQRILGEPPHVPRKSEPIEPLPKTEFALPPKHADTRRVFAYLRSRGIDAEIINHCIKHGQLYEDAERHNCVFVGYEHGNPAYGALRGTLSETTFAGEVPGSDKRFSFAVPLCAGGKTLCVFESAIDALSYLTLLKLRGQDWRARTARFDSPPRWSNT